ncbi:CHAT domain-containing protein [Phormidium sp. CCY1219]|uniref:CHAT domain-containing protein n=1 Tax=Phormidium sp. CCY1219 TaxID=2886104 RepID=UPI002D1F8819|nr:CHAT domain-containing protein [Phormidium sp. CCY1219]MEB3831559.1 CHAT domain-containing protein [Phormidium sp. CCY1219]
MKSRSFLIAALAVLNLTITHHKKILAQPIAPTPEDTGTRVTPEGDEFHIRGGKLSGDGANLFHSFERFGLDAGQSATFHSNPTIFNIVGRVTGGNASIINGLIQVTGGNSNLFLVNPAGIVFGLNASLNVPADFFATSATGIQLSEGHWFNSIGDNQWASLVGTPSAFVLPDNAGAIANFGHLSVQPEQNLTLLGTQVLNAGTLSAPGGTITLAAVPGEHLVRISQENHLLSLDVSYPAPLTASTNAFTSLWLPELLTGGSVSHGDRVEVRADGTLAISGSGIALDPHTGDAIATGTLDVAGGPGSPGGGISVLGERIALIGARVDASGRSGGEVFVGGTRQGRGPLPNALQTFVSEDSVVSADARTDGDGGQIVLFAAESATIGGTLTARGGARSGNGGFIETSGLQGLAVNTVPNVGAIAGLAGEWLIDPYNIEIVPGAGSSNINGISPFESAGHNAQLGVDLILQALDSGNVTIATGTGGPEAGNITLSTPLNYNLTLERTLKLNAHNNIVIDEPIAGATGSAPLNLILNGNNGNLAGGNGWVNVNRPISTSGGNLTIRGRRLTATEPGGGGVNLNSTISTLGGNVTLEGVAQNGGHRGIVITSNGALDSGGGEIYLSGTAANYNAFQGVRIEGQIASSGGNVTIVGESVRSQGILFNGGSVLDSGGGDISLIAENQNYIAIHLENTTLTSEGGQISLTGKTQDTAEPGVRLDPGISLDSGGGALEMTGESAGGMGISIATPLDSQGGAIALTGTSNGTEPGVGITGAISSNGGAIAITGSSNGTLDLDIQSAIDAGSGTINLTGDTVEFSGTNLSLSGSTLDIQPLDPANDLTIANTDSTPVEYRFDGITIGAETSSGTIALTGDMQFSGSLQVQSPETDGEIDLSASSLTTTGHAVTVSAGGNIRAGEMNSNGGAIALTADADNTNGGGVNLTNGAIATDGGEFIATGESITLDNSSIATDSGNISLTGTGSGGILLQDSTLKNGGRMTLTGNSFNFNGTTQLAGTGVLQIQPHNPDADLTLGSIGNRVQLDEGELNALQDGFERIIIGHDSGSGAIVISEAIAFRDPVTIQSPQGDGSITATAAISGEDNSAIQLNAATDVTTQDIAANAGISIRAGNELRTGNLDTSSTESTGTGGPIALNGTNRIVTGNIAASATSGNGGAISVASEGEVTPGNITTNNNSITLDAALSLDRSIAMDAGGGNLLLNGTVDGSHELYLFTQGTGTILLNGDIGSTTPLQTLWAKAPTTLAGDASANFLYFNAPLNAIGDPILSGNAMDFTDTVTGSGNLTLQTLLPDRDIRLGDVNNHTPALDLTVTELGYLQEGFASITIGRANGIGQISVADISLSDPFTVRSQTGTIHLSGAIAGSDNASLTLSTDGGIQLHDNIAVTTEGENITFDASLNGSHALQVSAGTGTVSFLRPVGDTTPLTDLTVTADEINLHDPLRGEGHLVLQPSTASLDVALSVQETGVDGDSSTLDLTVPELAQVQDGFQSITVGRENSIGTTRLGATQVSTEFSDSAIVRGDTLALNGTIATTEDASLTFTAANIRLEGGTEVRGNNRDIIFGGTVNGNYPLSVDAGTGNLRFDREVGNITPLWSLQIRAQSVEAASTIAIAAGGMNVTSNGTIRLDGAISVADGGAVKLTGEGDILTREITANQIDLRSISGAVDTRDGTLDTRANSVEGAEVEIKASGNISTGDIQTASTRDRGGAVSVSSTSGDITLGEIDTTGETEGGSLRVETPGNIAIGEIATGSPSGSGGAIALGSETTLSDIITTEDINASGAIDGGSVDIYAQTQVTSGAIDTSGTAGNGGDVFIDPDLDVQVSWIDAEGGIDGGNVEIITRRHFRATDTLTDASGQPASISTIGGDRGGSIIIRHGGGGEIPFVVGDPSVNGTAGRLVSGSTAIDRNTIGSDANAPGTFLYDYVEGNIQILPNVQPPTRDTASAEPSESVPEEPAEPSQPTVEEPVEPSPAASEESVEPSQPTVEEPTAPSQPAQTTDLPPTPPTVEASNSPPSADSASPSSPTEEPPSGEPPPAETASAEMPSEETVSAEMPSEETVSAETPSEETVSAETLSAETLLPESLSAEESVETSTEPSRSLSLSLPELSVGEQETEMLAATEAIAPATPAENSSPPPIAQPTPAENPSNGDDAEVEMQAETHREAIAPLENPGHMPQEQVLRVDPSVYRDLPNESGTSAPSTSQVSGRDTSPTTNGRASSASDSTSTPTSEGGSVALDDALAENNTEGAIWAIEQSWNFEFQEHLGVTAELPQQSEILGNFQRSLKTLTADTGKQSAILYVVTRPDRLELVLVPAVGDPIRKTVADAPQSALFPVITEFRQQVTDPKRRNLTTYLSSAQQLYSWMVEPFAGELEALQIETLLMSLDSGLRSIPVAALHDSEEFLIEKYSISLIPTFSLTSHSYSSMKNARLLAMGASEFADKAPLPAVPLELEAIAHNIWPGKSFINEEFTVETLEKQRETDRFEIIHLATHARFDSGNARNSYIQLWDERLELDEVPTLDLHYPPVDLLVLSACSTALGDREAELGFAGLAVHSGVKSAIASLWYVSDEATLALMTEFYTQLRRAPIKADALRQAQMAMIRGTLRFESGQLVNSTRAMDLPDALSQLGDSELSHPFYWAGFTTIGSPW